MEKRNNTTYWIAGILILLIVVLLIWFAASSRSKTVPGETSGSQDMASGSENQTTAMDHAAMGHGTTQSGETTAQDADLAAYLEEQDKLMTKMMEDMDGIAQSGYAPIDFLAGMIPHHEAAIAMAQSYLTHNGSHPELKQLAEDIIETQQEEIDQMNMMLEDLKEAGTKDTEKADAYRKDYQEMAAQHHGAHPTGDSLDAAFAEGMLLHHQMAVEMSQAILEYSEDEPVNQLAQNIIDTQTKEIGAMRSILNQE